ncbi:MAG: hypothetical protein Q9227_002064 [Pyrenula ochraceoflavens]
MPTTNKQAVKASPRHKSKKNEKSPQGAARDSVADLRAPGFKKRKGLEETPRTAATKRVKKQTPTSSTRKPKVVINKPSTERLNVYVCGAGNAGELGLGNAFDAAEAEVPRSNTHLNTIGVTQLAVGGMHCAALTHDNKIYTWGVNDDGALGRDTKWDRSEANKDADIDSDVDDDVNPQEAFPAPIPSEAFPIGTTFVGIAAGDSTTFVLTDEGLVYGWGTFRNNEGVWAFDAHTKIAFQPVPIPTLKNITRLVCGDNHVLALDNKGAVFAWGSGQQNQLGRRIVERFRYNALEPREFGLPKIKTIGSGAYHSFAVAQDNKVFSWGLNNYGETGVEDQTRLQIERNSDPTICTPQLVKSLRGKEITCITGGAHHSIAVTRDGQCLVWGRVDGYQMGIKLDSLPEDLVIKDERKKPRVLVRPTPNLDNITWAAAGSEHCIAITTEGKAFSWGFNASCQTGVGGSDDIETASPITAAPISKQRLSWAGAGGQFSVFAAAA